MPEPERSIHRVGERNVRKKKGCEMWVQRLRSRFWAQEATFSERKKRGKNLVKCRVFGGGRFFLSGISINNFEGWRRCTTCCQSQFNLCLDKGPKLTTRDPPKARSKLPSGLHLNLHAAFPRNYSNLSVARQNSCWLPFSRGPLLPRDPIPFFDASPSLPLHRESQKLKTGDKSCKTQCGRTRSMDTSWVT